MATFVQDFRPIETVSPLAGCSPQAINATSTTKNYPLGTRIKAVDRALGISEFVYATGVADTAEHNVLQINADFTTVRAAGGTAKGPAGIAMSACVAANYGWYCVKGRCEMTIAADAAAAAPVYINAAGVGDDAVVATKHLIGAAMEIALDAGGSAIVGTTDTTAAHTAIVYLADPVAVVAV